MKQVKSQKVTGYTADIPNVLVTMKNYLVQNGGLQQVELSVEYPYFVSVMSSLFPTVGGNISISAGRRGVRLCQKATG